MNWDWIGELHRRPAAVRVVAALVTMVIAVAVSRLVSWFISRHLRRLAARTKSRFDDAVINALDKPASWAPILVGLYVAVTVLDANIPLKACVGVVGGFLGVVFLLRLIDEAADSLRPLVHKTHTSLDDAALPALRTAAKIFVVIMAVLWVISTLGFSINSLLAGLGIGGLAIALAAQGTLANWFGAFMIFADRPFGAGDVVSVGTVTGFVEQVGLRSTSIRTFEGTIVTIPNSKIADAQIENVSRMPGRRFNGLLGIDYSTPVDKIELALKIIRDILGSHPKVQEGFLVNFEEFGDYALNIRVIYVTSTIDYREFMGIRETLNLAILREFAAAGIEIAFPTQTLYVKRAD